jgi:AmmeMemoRadiSam system protein B
MAEVRKAAVAGSWYPGTPSALAEAVDRHLARVSRDVAGELVAIVAPHAGLMYSGPVAAHAYGVLRGRAFDVAVLVGPSHFVGFDGVAAPAAWGFETPFGITAVDVEVVNALLQTGVVTERATAHAREHSLEMQLPFLARLLPDVPIVPLVMGYQTSKTATSLASALSSVLRDRKALLVASTDLSHYYDAATASRLDRVVVDHVEQFDADGLQRTLDAQPEHACGGGPTVAVMRAASALGARDAAVLAYGDSGDVSGDKSKVVGYMAAVMGNFA